MSDGPVYIARIGEKKKDGSTYWHRVGAVFAHTNGDGFNLVIPPGVALSGTIALFPPTEKEDDTGQ